MWLIILLPICVGVEGADAAANGQTVPTPARTSAAPSEASKVAPAKPLPNGNTAGKRDVNDACRASYDQLLKTNDKFRQLLERQPDAVVALQRYPILLQKQLAAVVQTHAQAVKQGQKARQAHTTSSAQRLQAIDTSKPAPESSDDRQQTTDNTHRAPAPAELRRRALRSLPNVPEAWVRRASRRAEILVKQISTSLERKEYDADQLKTQVDKLTEAFGQIACPKEIQSGDSAAGRAR